MTALYSKGTLKEEPDMQRIWISDIGKYENQDIEIAGWIYNIRSKGKIHFLQLRDGTGRVQGVAVNGECDTESFEF